ncbi:MAG: hypothetical protein WAO98_01220 [Alphaproteobacteria bacterium]
MPFKDYALREHIDAIDDHPGSSVAVVIGFTRKDLETLMAMTEAELTKRPSIHAQIAQLPPGHLARNAPHLTRIPEEMVRANTVANPNMGMPSIFATLGYASKCGREIKFFFGEPLGPKILRPDTVQTGVLASQSLADLEDNILKGAQAFFNEAHEKLGRPERAILYAFVQPMSLS